MVQAPSRNSRLQIHGNPSGGATDANPPTSAGPASNAGTRTGGSSSEGSGACGGAECKGSLHDALGNGFKVKDTNASLFFDTALNLALAPLMEALAAERFG